MPDPGDDATTQAVVAALAREGVGHDPVAARCKGAWCRAGAIEAVDPRRGRGGYMLPAASWPPARSTLGATRA